MSAFEMSTIPTVYEPTDTGLPPLRPYVGELWERRRFIWHLARTDLKSKHYETTLGQLWIVLDPLFMAAVYFLLRSVVQATPAGADRSAILSHLLWGVFFFYYTSNALMGGARSLLSGRGLILNAAFPRAALPLVEIVKAMFDFLPTLVVYFGFHAALGQPFGTALVVLPLLVVLQTTLNVGLALLFAPVMLFFRDTGGFLPYVNRVWLYVTPTLYTLAEIPDKLVAFLRWNPLYPFYGALEQIFGGRFPSAGYLLAATTWAVALFAGGVFVFLAKERDFAVRL